MSSGIKSIILANKRMKNYSGLLTPLKEAVQISRKVNKQNHRGSGTLSNHIWLFTCFGVSWGCTTVTAVHEDNVVEHIEEQTYNSDREDEQRFLSLLRVNKPLDCFNQDAKHQSSGKNRVAKSSQHICPAETKGVSLVPSDAAEPDTEETDDHGDEVRENSKGI